jgi:hypothetical protein
VEGKVLTPGVGRTTTVLVLAGLVLTGLVDSAATEEVEGETVTVRVLVLVECTVLVRVLVDSGMGVEEVVG